MMYEFHSEYYTAQICKNGHIIVGNLENFSERSAPYCSICGEKTISQCENCGEKIRGDFPQYPYTIFLRKPPAYCHKCGHPFPWTESALQATRELIWEDEDLFDDEKKKIIQSLPDIIAETPKTSLAVIRMKKAAMRCMPAVKEFLMDFVVKFGCEFAKKQLGV